MRKERLTYQDLLRKILAGRLLRRQERRVAEEILGIPDAVDAALRLDGLLEGVADRGGLIRLARRSGDRPSVKRYLDPSTNDRWTVELPGPQAMSPSSPPPPEPDPGPPPDPAPKADREPETDTEPEGDATPETDAAPAGEPAEPEPPAVSPPAAPRLVHPVEEITIVPAVPRRFDDGSGEPFDTLFTSFSPCKTPEEIAAALAPIRAQLLERTGATDVRFHFLLEAGGELVAVPFRGHTAQELVPLGGRVRSAVLGERKTLHVPNLEAHGTDARPEDRGALVAFPLVAGDRVSGLMEVLRDHPGPFDPEELQLFAMAALITAGLVERAEVLEKLIFLDKLTGLYNRAYFDDQIEREIERANRMGTSVALLMGDLDHFKKINDTRGHQAGDLALAHVASIIRANIRQIDVAARYGGEEFAVLLPSITRSRAELTAERLRRVVADAKLGDIYPELAEARLSISVGIALYPDDAATAKQLIDRADRVALYAAKNWGRNRVVSWAEARDANEKLKPGR